MKKGILFKVALLSSIGFENLFFASCSKSTSLYISQTTNSSILNQKATLVNGYANVVFQGFVFNNIENFDASEMSIQYDGFNEYAKKCKGTVASQIINLQPKGENCVSFDIQITFSNFLPSNDPIKSEFWFSYNSMKVETNSQIFTLSFDGSQAVDEILLPTSQSFDTNFRSGSFSSVIHNFSYLGLKTDIKNLKVSANCVFDKGNVNCKIINTDEYTQKFDLWITAYDIPDINGENLLNISLNFVVEDRVIKCDNNTLTLSLDTSTEYPDFRYDDWENIGLCARTSGFEGLQKRYGIETFIGLAKTININGIDHVVRVVDEQCESLYNTTTGEGNRSSLTFMFENAITEKDDSNTFFSKKIQWSTSNNIWEFQTIKANINEWLNYDFLKNYMPYEIVGFIPYVRKNTILQSTQTAVKSIHRVWLPSLSEVGGYASNNIFSVEGPCYKYFDNISSNNSHSKRKFKMVDGSLSEQCWLRTPALDNSNTVYGIFDGSIMSYYLSFNVTNLNAITPCFCL